MSGSVTRTRTKTGTLTDVVRRSPVDRYLETRRRRIGCSLLLLLLALAGGYLVLRFTADQPVVYDDIGEHFKYGSIGAEPGVSLLAPAGGVLPPYWVFRLLPEICPEKLPGGYASLGLLYEPGRDLPIGVSRRYRLGLDQVGLNCAVCHTGTVRETPASPRQVVLGMPAHQLEIEELFRFVLDCSLDPRLTADNLVGRIEAAGGELDFLDRLIYRTMLVSQVKLTVLGLEQRIAVLLTDDVTPWGAGRVDTFNPYKSIQFNWPLEKLPHDELIGASDYPSLWNQEPRAQALPQAPDGMWLHWDGNNNSVDERNLSASLGAGVTPRTIDHAALKRVADWAWTLPPPPYPFPIDEARARQGEPLYQRYCADCHADHRFREGEAVGSRVGTVVPLAEIGTDPFRLHSYTSAFAANQYALYPASRYQFRHFRKTNGYANHPLDGIWARAPYLHNGSVPTLRDLLEPPEDRPAVFYRGYDVYDQERVGFVHDVAEEGGKRHFLFDTALPGNGNQGHLYGLELTAPEKDALVEYMKRL
jgi:mono/diheme cytochrome c family protein